MSFQYRATYARDKSMTSYKEIPFLGDFISGHFVLPQKKDKAWTKVSPADLEDKILSSMSCYAHVEVACEAAQRAYLPWATYPIEKRKAHLWKLKEIFLKEEKAVAELISRETGKPLWESMTEAKALSNKVDVTLEHSLKLIEEQVVAAPGKVKGFTRFLPRGVMAVVGPFNFPMHLANGHIIPSLLAGNTVVFKPSELTPASGQKLIEMIQEAGLPSGVVNMVQGDSTTGKNLIQSKKVDGVLFTGSYETGLHIQQQISQHYWKILALEMGGKNTSIIWEDADLDKALYESIMGAFLTAGQRCSSSSQIIVHKKLFSSFVKKFCAIAKKIKIGHWKDDPFMGPLIHSQAVEKYIQFQEIAQGEGHETKMKGDILELQPKGYYVTPSIHLVHEVKKDSTYLKNEIFGPNVAILSTNDFDEAMDIVHLSGYGLSLALFTQQKALYMEALLKAKVGLLNWNRTTNGASSLLPFGGMGKSGNDRPSGHFALQYCTTPVASLEDPNPFDREKLPPGLV